MNAVPQPPEWSPTELDVPTRAAAADLPGPGRAGARRRRAGPAAADRRVLGGRGAQAADRRGPARRAVPAAGRRLRRDLRRLRLGPDRPQAQDPAADEPGAAARHEEAGDPRRPHRRPVRQAALRRHRDAGRRDAAELSRRPRQPPGLHGGRARARSRAAAARLRARGADAELRARADRRRLRRPAPPGVLGPGLRAALAAGATSTSRSRRRSPTRSTSSRR